MLKDFQPTIKYNLTGTFCISALLLILVAFLQSSCGPGPVDAPRPNDTGLFKTYDQGPLTLIQKTSKKEMTVADQLAVVLETSAPENMKVEFPTYSASLGDFTLIDITVSPARLVGTGDNVRVIHEAEYLVEPYLPGTYSIPKMTITYLDRNNGTESTQLVTEELQVTVKSLLDQDAAIVEIKDIKGPLSLPENTGLQILLVIVFLLLVLLGVAGFLYWQKKSSKKKPVEVQLRPEEIALQELERLLAENLLARGEIKLFHLRISDILRHYIENRFGYQAPERTTEEFLTELSQARSQKNTFPGNHKTLLADFLTHCDLVKFAKHEPTKAESEKTVSICREFIAATEEKDERNNVRGEV
jgi:hypothetical protein